MRTAAGQQPARALSDPATPARGVPGHLPDPVLDQRPAESTAARRAHAIVARIRSTLATRHAWWQELIAILGGYWLYSLTRGAAAGKRTVALAHGRWIYHLEQDLHIDPEKALNRALTHSHWLAEIASYYYGSVHFILTALVLALLWWRRPADYGRLRTVLVILSLTCLLIFWLVPVAPPRFAVPGMVDTLTSTDAIGARSEHGIFSLANLYAAMPSLHVAWASWVALVGTVTAPRRWMKWVVWLYPAFTTWVVLATANHYVLDVVAGVAVTFLAAVVTGLFLCRPGNDRVVILPDAETVGVQAVHAESGGSGI